MKSALKRLCLQLGVAIAMLPSAFAADGDASKTIGTALSSIFGWIFVDFNKEAGTFLYYFYLKFAFWVLLFALFFYASKFVFKDQKQIQIVVSLVLAFLGVVLMPEELLVATINAYTIVGTFMLLGIPIAGVILLNHYAFNKPERAFYMLKAIGYYILASLIYNIANVEWHVNFLDFEKWAGFAGGLCLILMLWNGFKAIFPGDDSKKAPEGNLMDKIGHMFPGSGDSSKSPEERKKEKEGKKAEEDEEKAEQAAKKIQERIDVIEDNIDQIKDGIMEIENKNDRIDNLERAGIDEIKKIIETINLYISKIKSSIEKYNEIDKEIELKKIDGDRYLKSQMKNLQENMNVGLKKAISLFNSYIELLRRLHYGETESRRNTLSLINSLKEELKLEKMEETLKSHQEKISQRINSYQQTQNTRLSGNREELNVKWNEYKNMDLNVKTLWHNAVSICEKILKYEEEINEIKEKEIENFQECKRLSIDIGNNLNSLQNLIIQLGRLSDRRQRININNNINNIIQFIENKLNELSDSIILDSKNKEQEIKESLKAKELEKIWEDCLKNIDSTEKHAQDNLDRLLRIAD